MPNRAAGGILALARGDPPPTPTLPFNAHIYTPPPPAKLPGQRRHTEHPALNGEGEERERESLRVCVCSERERER